MDPYEQILMLQIFTGALIQDMEWSGVAREKPLWNPILSVLWSGL